MKKIKTETPFFYIEMKSPVGRLRLYANDHALIGLYMEKEKPGPWHGELKKAKRQETKILHQSRTQVEEYFAGKRSVFTIPIELRGTAFQKQVWKSLMEIKSGKLRSYGEHALKILKPKAVRAVGTAIGSNPITIIIPCHRVVGSTGSLTGYAGGLEVKMKLLRLEGHEIDGEKVNAGKKASVS